MASACGLGGVGGLGFNPCLKQTKILKIGILVSCLALCRHQKVSAITIWPGII